MKGQRSVVRSPLPYTVPEELAEHVDFGTSDTGAEAAQRSRCLGSWCEVKHLAAGTGHLGVLEDSVAGPPAMVPATPRPPKKLCA